MQQIGNINDTKFIFKGDNKFSVSLKLNIKINLSKYMEKIVDTIPAKSGIIIFFKNNI